MAVGAHSDGNAGEVSEKRRLQRLNETYSSSPYYRKIWRRDSPASRLMFERKWELIRLVLKLERLDLGTASILDLGVGSGTDGPPLKELSVQPGRFVGLDLLDRCAREARQNHPWMNTIAGDAANLPFADRRFDVVYQSTMISSVPDPSLRQRIWSEIARVLVPGGVLLSYDTRYPNPWNPHTRPVRFKEVEHALSTWRVRAWSVTAIPQLQRALAPISHRACRLLEAVPPLRSHFVILARKP